MAVEAPVARRLFFARRLLSSKGSTGRPFIRILQSGQPCLAAQRPRLHPTPYTLHPTLVSCSRVNLVWQLSACHESWHTDVHELSDSHPAEVFGVWSSIGCVVCSATQITRLHLLIEDRLREGATNVKAMMHIDSIRFDSIHLDVLRVARALWGNRSKT
jgi:hypothetical protein